MQTQAEIEEQLGQAADRMRQVSKAAKDQEAKASQEPADAPLPDLGQPVTAPGAVIKTER